MTTIKSIQKKYSTIARLDLTVLIARVLDRPREFIYSDPDYKLSIFERATLAYFLFLYKRGWSVAVITHHKEFYGLNFFVNKHTLVPRPETELLVEEVVSEISNIEHQTSNQPPNSNNTNNKIILIDVGTGSGCIPIAVAKKWTGHDLKIFATDISRRALHVARRNARAHNVSINFLRGNLLEPIMHCRGVYQYAPTVIITANLPYLTAEQFNSEPSIQREPLSALVADDGGLALYDELLKQIKSLVIPSEVEESLDRRGQAISPLALRLGRNDKTKFVILLEIDPSQSLRISTLIKKYFPTAKIEIKIDLALRDRLVKISL